MGLQVNDLSYLARRKQQPQNKDQANYNFCLGIEMPPAKKIKLKNTLKTGCCKL